MKKIKWIIIHHTAANNSLEIDNEWHKTRWNLKSSLGYYLGYDYYITEEGEVIKTRTEEDESMHTLGMNNKSIGIALQGNFNILIPTTYQISSLKGLILELTDKYDIPLSNIVPHRYFASTNCYGKSLSDDWAKNLVKGYFQLKLITLLTQLITYLKRLKEVHKIRKLSKDDINYV